MCGVCGFVPCLECIARLNRRDLFIGGLCAIVYYIHTLSSGIIITNKIDAACWQQENTHRDVMIWSRIVWCKASAELASRILDVCRILIFKCLEKV